MSNLIWEKVENCFSGSQTYQYILDSSTDDAFLDALSTLGALEVKRNFRRPFFFLRIDDNSEVRGTLGDNRIKASFPNESWESSKLSFEKGLEKALEVLA